MRLMIRSATAIALLATLFASPIGAEDAPDLPRPVPPPRPQVAGLLDRLLSDNGDERAGAEASVRKASPEVLRILLFAMRDRAARAESDGGTESEEGLPSEPDATRSDRAVSQEARFFEVEASAASRLLAVKEGGSDPTHRILASAESKTLAESLAREAGATNVATPNITTFDGQRATVEVLDQKSYVADFDVEVQGKTFVADPVIGTYVKGLRLETRAKILHDGKTVAAGLDLDVRRHVEPVAEETLPRIGDAPPMKVQRPEIVGSRWTRSVAVPASHTLLVAFPAGFGASPGRRLVLLYTPSLVDPDESGAPRLPDAPPGK
jgi:hypothetical protein